MACFAGAQLPQTSGADRHDSGPVPPYPRVAARLVGAAQVEGRAFQRLRDLTDHIGARLTGSPQAAAAQQWAARIMREDGHEHVRLEKVTVPVWVRGAETAAIVAPVHQRLAVTALGGSIATPAGGLEAEVVEADSFASLEALGRKAVAGRLVLFNRDMSRTRENGYGKTVALRVQGPVEAARLGAVGMLVRSLGTAAYRLPHTGTLRYAEEVPPIPAAAVSEEDADLIHRLRQSDGTVRLYLQLGCETRPEVEEANVVGEITGREQPEEIVLIGAHLDSWDLGTGALDDGFGVAVVLEAMRLLRTLDLIPRRTIRAVLFANEENGLRGGHGYARAHANEMGRHVAAIESDSGGAALAGWTVGAGAGGEERVRDLAAPLAALGGGEVGPGEGGADISPLARQGVPQIGLRQDSTHYFDYHHTAADTLDKVNPGDLAASSAAMAVMAYSLAEWPGTLPRLPRKKDAP